MKNHKKVHRPHFTQLTSTQSYGTQRHKSLDILTASMAMTSKSKKSERQPRRQLPRTSSHPLLLSLLVTLLVLNTPGSAFIPLVRIIHTASAMSTDSSNNPGVNSRPLAATAATEDRGACDNGSNDNDSQLPRLTEASGDSVIPSIKLGGTWKK